MYPPTNSQRGPSGAPWKIGSSAPTGGKSQGVLVGWSSRSGQGHSGEPRRLGHRAGTWGSLSHTNDPKSGPPRVPGPPRGLSQSGWVRAWGARAAVSITAQTRLTGPSTAICGTVSHTAEQHTAMKKDRHGHAGTGESQKHRSSERSQTQRDHTIEFHSHKAQAQRSRGLGRYTRERPGLVVKFSVLIGWGWQGWKKSSSCHVRSVCKLYLY